jgi:hypothetical protein
VVPVTDIPKHYIFYLFVLFSFFLIARKVQYFHEVQKFAGSIFLWIGEIYAASFLPANM